MQLRPKLRSLCGVCAARVWVRLNQALECVGNVSEGPIVTQHAASRGTPFGFGCAVDFEECGGVDILAILSYTADASAVDESFVKLK